MTTKFSRRSLLAAGAAAGTSLITRPGAATAAAAQPDAATPGASLPGIAFTHVTVIDPHLGQVRHDMTVVVRGQTITAVGRSGQVRVPAGSSVVDLRGKFLIPGLADMHFPGFSVHDELRFLVEAGLPPMAALHAATGEPAAFLGLKTGRIAAGHAADLVVLGADPLRDVGNTQRIDGVVVRGRYVDAAERIRMLREVEDAAAAMPEDMVATAACACHG